LATDQRFARKLPGEIKIEMLTAQDALAPRVQEVAAAIGRPEGKPEAWARSLSKYLADGDAMIVSARIGRTLVGFLVLEPENAMASCAWVSEHARDRGLGQRFYSFACINLAQPAPQFMFHKDMFAEFEPVLKRQGLEAMLKDTYYVVSEREAA
jgi:hypothetical protein